MSSILAWVLRQFVILKACNCLKDDHNTVNLASHWYELDCLLVRSVIFRITSTSGLIIGQICRQFLHDFSVNSGAILTKFFSRNIFCYMPERCVKIFNGSKMIKDGFERFLYSVSLKSDAFKFWQLVCKLISIRSISFNDFMKMEGPKTKFM